jgi:hypothetical protein
MPTPSADTIIGNITPQMNSQETYSVTGAAGSAYNWHVTGGTLISGANSNSITVQWDGTGTGTVAVIESNPGCTGETITLNVTVGNTGVATAGGIEGLKVYPNPGDGKLFVSFPASGRDVVVEVTDGAGKLVHKLLGKQVQGEFHRAMDLSHLPSGVYVLRIVAGDQSASVKVTLTGK